MATLPVIVRRKQVRKLLILGYDATESDRFAKFIQPDEFLNKLDLSGVSRQDLQRLDPDLVICSGSAYRALLSLPHASIADDPKLNARQREILVLIQKGLSNRQIAEVTGLRERTIKGEITTLFTLFEVANRTELASTSPV